MVDIADELPPDFTTPFTFSAVVYNVHREDIIAASSTNNYNFKVNNTLLPNWGD